MHSLLDAVPGGGGVNEENFDEEYWHKLLGIDNL